MSLVTVDTSDSTVEAHVLCPEHAEEARRAVGLRPPTTENDRPPNFRREGKLYLVRCFACGAENWAPSVAEGVCAWCGWKEA